MLSRRSEPGQRHYDKRDQHGDCEGGPENEYHGRICDCNWLETVPGKYNQKGNPDAKDEIEEWSAEAGGVTHPLGGKTIGR